MKNKVRHNVIITVILITLWILLWVSMNMLIYRDYQANQKQEKTTPVDVLHDSVNISNDSFIEVDSDYKLYMLARDYDPTIDEYTVTIKFKRID